MTAPETTIGTKPANPTTATSASFSFTSSEAGSTFQCALDTAAFAACTSPKSYTALAAGSHTFQVKATDAAGNVDASAASYTWTVSGGTGTSTLLPTEDAYVDGGATTTNFGTAVDLVSDGSPVKVAYLKFDLASLAGKSVTSAKLRMFVTNGSPGVQNVKNVDTNAWSEATVNFSTRPATSTTITTFVPGTTLNVTKEADLTSAVAAKVGGLISLAIDSVDADGYAFSSKDASANKVELLVQTGAPADTTPPETTISSSPTNPTNSTSASFGFTSSETGSTFQCALDTAAFAACISPQSYTALAAGSHTFQVKATDAAGNTDASAASYTWTIQAADTTPPETTITAQPANPTTATSASFSFTSSEAGSTFQCALDTAAFAACTSPQSYAGLAAGSHTFQVKATDAAGNVDATPASYTWTIQSASGLFADGFESGGFSAWSAPTTAIDGTAVVQTTVVKAGTYAAELAETATAGSAAYVRKNFAATQTDVTVSGDFRIAAEGAPGGNVPIFRLFEPSGTRIISLYRQNQGLDKIRVTHSGTGFDTTGVLPLNTWGHIDLHVITAGTGASTIEISLNGTQIYKTTTASLGTAGTLTLQIGNNTTAQAFRLFADDISARIGA